MSDGSCDSEVAEGVVHPWRPDHRRQNGVVACLKDVKGASIVYTRSRQAAIDTSYTLNQKGLETTYFHGGLTTQQKKESLQVTY